MIIVFNINHGPFEIWAGPSGFILTLTPRCTIAILMLVFIDESGDVGLRQREGSSRFFFVTAVLFEDNEAADACDERIDRLREEMKLHPQFEFHFNACRRQLREHFLREISAFQFFYHTIGIDKDRLADKALHEKNAFYSYATGLVFENAKPRLRNAKVVIDKTGSQKFRSELAKYLKKKMNEPGAELLIRKVVMESSRRNNLLQVADMVCGAVARSFAGGKKDHADYRKIISHRELLVDFWPK